MMQWRLIYGITVTDNVFMEKHVLFMEKVWICNFSDLVD